MPTPEPCLITSSSGVSVALHDLGGTGEPVLFCHATGFHGRVWEPVVAELADRYHALAVDFRGHGDSVVPEGLDYQWSGMVDDVLAVVDQLGAGAPRLAVGWSMGGAAIVMAEQRRPATFDRAWLMEPILIPIDHPWGSAVEEESSLAVAARRRREVFESRDAAYERYVSRPPFDSCDPRAVRAYVDHGFRDRADGTVILKCRGAIEAAVFEASLTDGFDKLGQVRTETTVASSGDGAPPASAGPGIAAALPNGRHERLDELTHFAPLEDPATVASRIVAALAPPPDH